MRNLLLLLAVPVLAVTHEGPKIETAQIPQGLSSAMAPQAALPEAALPQTLSPQSALALPNGDGVASPARPDAAQIGERVEAIAAEIGAQAWIPEGDYDEVGITRVETLDGIPYKVIDISEYVAQRRAKSEPDLLIFEIERVFKKPRAFLGFGLPNVYLTIPTANGPHKVAAKSAWRADTKVVDTKGRVQSGLLVVLRDLDAAALARMEEVAKQHEGGRNITCVRANCLAMKDMGFTVGDRTMDSYKWPNDLLADILKYGLKLDGRPVAFDLVRTTPYDLETFGAKIQAEVRGTLRRHIGRMLSKSDDAAAPIPVPEKTQDVVVRYPSSAPSETDLTLEVSQPTGFGRHLRGLWGPHILYRLRQSRVPVSDYLKEPLKAYEKSSDDLVTRLKHGFFNEDRVSWMRSHLAGTFQSFERIGDRHVFDMMNAHTDAKPNKFNLVIEGDGAISLMAIDGASRVKRFLSGLADWVLTKHVLMSGYSKDVRFAGEVWKGADGLIYLSNNSGTYAPTAEQLGEAINYLQAVFPGGQFVLVKL